MRAGLTICSECRFWHGQVTCRRHAPSAAEDQFQIARWPETRANDACGEGVGIEAGRQEPQACGSCLYWDRPGIGIDPARRGDRAQSWWLQAGWCRRFAPRPGYEIGEHAFWRATHATDGCYDGRPAADAG